MEKDKKFTVLYVDDEESNLNIFRNTFRREYKVLTASNAQEGLDLLKQEKIDLILTDQRMPDMDGVSFLKQTIDRFPELNRILITGYTDFDALKTAVNEAKIFQYIQKPWREEQLRTIIDKALELYQLRKENQSLTHQLQQKNKELEQMNNDLLEIDKLKTDFLSIISHEIRTPLNGIMGSVDLLKQDAAEEGAESLSALIYILETSVNRLEKFLLSAERVTQLRSGTYRLFFEKVNPLEVINHVVEAKLEDISCKNCTIEKIINSDRRFEADRKLVAFCLDELIDNSLKYSPGGSTVKVSTSETNDWLIVCVEDNGVGFSEKMLKNCFQLFISDTKSDQQKGLSLAIIGLIMDAHNGKVEIENKAEGGASVRLFFKQSID